MSDIDETITEQWESGALGQDAAHARRVSVELEDEVERVLAMKLVTIRLPVPMIEALKAIAHYHGIGYQPMVRDLLNRFITSEIPTILSQIEKRAAEAAPEKTAPVDNFMGQRRACG
ncbi:MAG: hypothetical protein R3F10_03535 [Lysobacteraceae bacterium]